jgi:nucleotide-binding universal stress UspA family protein
MGSRMKSILVPTGGSDQDKCLFETALAAARPFAAHLNFLHVRVSAGQSAMQVPHADFASGPALRDTLVQLERKAETRSIAAAQHIRDFCERSKIALCDVPHSASAVSASWREDIGDPLRRITFHARHHDLVVVARAKRPNGLPADFIDLLLLSCGRPVLIAGSTPPQTLTKTVMVCWRESADAARAVTAATPFLTQAKRVVFASVAERSHSATSTLAGIARQFEWNGIPVETKLISPNGRSPKELLPLAAEECDADLVVMGAYGHSHLREVIFGGCTQDFINHAAKPVLLMH